MPTEVRSTSGVVEVNKRIDNIVQTLCLVWKNIYTTVCGHTETMGGKKWCPSRVCVWPIFLSDWYQSSTKYYTIQYLQGNNVLYADDN